MAVCLRKSVHFTEGALKFLDTAHGDPGWVHQLQKKNNAKRLILRNYG